MVCLSMIAIGARYERERERIDRANKKRAVITISVLISASAIEPELELAHVDMHIDDWARPTPGPASPKRPGYRLVRTYPGARTNNSQSPRPRHVSCGLVMTAWPTANGQPLASADRMEDAWCRRDAARIRATMYRRYESVFPAIKQLNLFVCETCFSCSRCGGPLAEGVPFDS